MPILIRYLLTDLLKVFLVVLAGMTMLIMLVGVVREALIQGLGAPQVLQMLPFILPEALRFAVPGTVLFATASVYGRLSSSNELVAIKSLGISPLALIWPTVVLTVVISLATVWLNDLAVSWGRAGIQRVVIESVEEIAYGMLRAQRCYRGKQFSVTVRDVEDRVLIKPMFTIAASGNSPPVTITAEKAELRSDPEQNALTILFHNSEVEVGDQVSFAHPDTFERMIPLTENSRPGETSPSYLPMRLIPSETVRQKIKIRSREQQLAAGTAFCLTRGNVTGLANASWHAETQALTNDRYRLFRLQSEPHRRWANGFSCLCFMAIGAPIAIRLRNADFLTSFFLCFGPILVVYYPLLAFSVDRAKNGALPPYIVWLGDVILLACGLWAMRKVIRY